MSLELIPLTRDGYNRLHKELDEYKSVQRPEIIRAIAVARAHGDLKENAEYHAARERQGFIEARIADLEDKLSRAEIIDLTGKKIDSICFGTLVTLSDEDTGETKKYRIVGDLEADLSKHMVSISSPIAKALMGKKIKDLIEMRVPAGTKEYIVLDISF